MHYSTTDVNALETEEQESIEILDNSGRARKSKLVTSGNTICFPYEDLKTTWDAVIRGQKLSGNGQCFGWRNFKSSYSWITYGDFIKKAEIFGSGLVKIGLNPCPSSNVGIYAQNGIEWVVAQFGVWSKSSVVIPLYDTLGPDAFTFIIKQAEIKIVICDKENKVRNLLQKKKEMPTLQHIITTFSVNHEFNKLASEKHIELHTFDEIEKLGEKYSTVVLPPQSFDTALICYTSGTTGIPKGVIMTHENLVSVCCAVTLYLEKSSITKEDTTLSYLPLAHIFGQFIHAQCLILSKSKTDTYDERFIPETVVRAACKPFIDNLGGKLRMIITGAAPIYSNVVEFYTKFVGCKVFEIYGQTECCGPCCAILLDTFYDGCAGEPLPCCMIKVADVPDMGYFSKDSKGEVCIKGINVFKGYLKDPEKTAEALDTDGWLHTGDIGVWLPGEYVALEKIENIYGLSPFVSQVFVQGDSLKSFLVAIVIPDKETVLLWCKENSKCGSWREICDDSAVKKLIFEDMLRRGMEYELNSFEQVKAIHLHPEVLTSETGFFTPTLKLKRGSWKKFFAKQIETLYNNYK